MYYVHYHTIYAAVMPPAAVGYQQIPSAPHVCFMHDLHTFAVSRDVDAYICAYAGLVYVSTLPV